MNSVVRTVAFWFAILLCAFLFWQAVKTVGNAQKEKEITLSEFMSDVDQGNVHDVTFVGQEAKGKLKNGTAFHTVVPPNYPDVYKKLREKGVTLIIKDISNDPWPTWIATAAPLFLLGVGAFWLFIIAALGFCLIRQMRSRRSGGDGPSSSTPSQDSRPHFGS
jgi:cell division protease FtsH